MGEVLVSPLVTACLVTRGDHDLTPILQSLPQEWPVAIWDNSVRENLSVYGRYAILSEIETELAYCQDDDVIVSDPGKLVEEWQGVAWQGTARIGQVWSGMVCNQPPEFRHSFYEDHSLVGFGAVFDRAVPERAFARFLSAQAMISPESREWFHRCCDIVATCLTPRVLVDVPKTDLPYATDETRMYRQRDHVGERTRMLELARMVRDA